MADANTTSATRTNASATASTTASTTTTTPTPPSSLPNKLQLVNIANVIAYILNVLVTYGVGATNWLDTPSNAELSAKYQTLITPAGLAFSIWGVIFTSQLIWTIGQCLPSYRAQPLVVKSVGYYYVLVCLAQIGWTIAFALESIVASLGAMVSILILLLWIVKQLTNYPAGSRGLYWLLKFPFEIHAAWIVAATCVNTSVVLVYEHMSVHIQAIVAWLSLLILALVGFYFNAQRLYVFPVVLAWASFFVAYELSNPKDSIVNQFTAVTIFQVMAVSGGLAAILLITVLLTAVLDYYRNRQTVLVNTQDVSNNHNSTSRSSSNVPYQSMDN